MSERIGILGGTFDPIHLGHRDVALAACTAIPRLRIVIVPANIPPHRSPPAASSYHRFAMAALMAASRSGWTVCDMELQVHEPSYTSQTLRRFHALGYAPHELFFLTGADAFLEIQVWKDYPSILDAAHFVAVSRPGLPAGQLPARLPGLAGRMVRPPLAADAAGATSIVLIDADTADVSATAIRQRRAEGRSIAGMVDESVRYHIEQHGLYTAAARGRRGSDGCAGSPAGRLHGQD
ncbi:MAG: nicotinate (nicotinamide) nucleotide adenylyltransferase [Acidobacteria bacterium]|nr:nicotinate (nicotinamide) nucleotide adenylyltransferase [Acidobacteriota bacterium]